MERLGGFIYLLICIATVMIDWTMNHSIWFAFWSFFFTPICWIWWLLAQTINIHIIHQTFSFFWA